MSDSSPISSAIFSSVLDAGGKVISVTVSDQVDETNVGAY